MDAYGYPVSILIIEGQHSDVTYAIPVLENIDLTGSDVLADRGYDCWKLIDHIYEKGGEPSIPSKKGQNLSGGMTGDNSKKDTW